MNPSWKRKTSSPCSKLFGQRHFLAVRNPPNSPLENKQQPTKQRQRVLRIKCDCWKRPLWCYLFNSLSTGALSGLFVARSVRDSPRQQLTPSGVTLRFGTRWTARTTEATHEGVGLFYSTQNVTRIKAHNVRDFSIPSFFRSDWIGPCRTTCRHRMLMYGNFKRNINNAGEDKQAKLDRLNRMKNAYMKPLSSSQQQSGEFLSHSHFIFNLKGLIFGDLRRFAQKNSNGGWPTNHQKHINSTLLVKINFKFGSFGAFLYLFGSKIMYQWGIYQVQIFRFVRAESLNL